MILEQQSLLRNSTAVPARSKWNCSTHATIRRQSCRRINGNSSVLMAIAAHSLFMATQYFTACSLDGFIATPDDSLEWLFPLGEINDTGYPDFIRDVGALAMGSTTYQWMLRHVINADASKSGLWPYEQPTWVFSTRPQEPVAGADIRFGSGDVAAVHRDMLAVAKHKNIWLVGGGELVGQFYDAGLLDEMIVQIGSVTLGAGKPLLPRFIAFPPLQLQSARAIGPGFAELRYSVPRKAQT